MQELVPSGVVVGETLRLVGCCDERVVADVGDVALELRELLVSVSGAVDAEELRLVAVLTPHDRHDRLPGQIPREKADIRLVDVQPDRVDELPPRCLRGVEVACDVEPSDDVSTHLGH